MLDDVHTCDMALDHSILTSGALNIFNANVCFYRHPRRLQRIQFAFEVMQLSGLELRGATFEWCARTNVWPIRRRPSILGVAV